MRRDRSLASRVLTAASAVALAITLCAILPVSARGQSRSGAGAPDSNRTRSVDTVRVTGRIADLIGSARTASEGHVGTRELAARPLSREGELLETVPGLVVTQHSGEGKANQYFVRGFNLDHGTDFRTLVDGVPINQPTHGHGQGYTDLNFVIPEFVRALDYKLGVYHAEVGDFGSAGSAELFLAKRFDRPLSLTEVGSNGLARIVLGESRRVFGGDLLLGGEIKRYDGPWLLAETLRKFSGLARYSRDAGASQFSVLALAYGNRWNSNDQIPLRSVESHAVARFGQIDSTDGGNTRRFSLSATLRHVGASSVQNITLYGVYSQLNLFSNFTYFLNDPVHGDQFEQPDRRTVLGGSATNLQEFEAFGTTHRVKYGVQFRADLIAEVGLYRTERQQRLASVRSDRVREMGSGLFAEAESHWSPWLRTVLGIRADAYDFDVRGDRAENSGHSAAALASPKASIIVTPGAGIELYASGGLGFHSNDARGTTITVDPSSGEPVQRVTPLVRSRGAEIGLRVSPLRGLRTTVTAWALDLESELLFSGDAGATDASARSSRRGITVANFYRPVPQLSIDADVSFAHAQLHSTDAAASSIPGALESVVAAGVSWTPVRDGLSAALRVRHLGSYALIEDNSARASATALVNAELGYRLQSGISLSVSLLNALGSTASDIQYFYASRLKGEPVDGVNDVHFHPVEPRQVRAGLRWGL